MMSYFYSSVSTLVTRSFIGGMTKTGYGSYTYYKCHTDSRIISYALKMHKNWMFFFEDRYDITELSKEGKRKTGSLVACIKKYI